MIVWIASYPRSGNTLTRLLLRQVFGKYTYSKYNDTQDLGSDPAIAHMVGHVSYRQTWRDFRARADEKKKLYLVKTHDAPEDDAKAIYVVREGRSAIVSYAAYLNQFGRQEVSLQDVNLGTVTFGGWSQHYDAWKPHDRPNTLLIKFEDLLAKPGAMATELSDFLELPIRGAFTASFDSLHERFPEFFRSGDNKKSEAEFEEGDNQLFEYLHGPLMRRLGYATKSSETHLDAFGPMISSVQLYSRLRLERALRAEREIEALKARIKDLRAEVGASATNKSENAVVEEKDRTIEDLRSVLARQSEKVSEQGQEIDQLKSMVVEKVKRIEDLRRGLLGGPRSLLRARRMERTAPPEKIPSSATSPASGAAAKSAQAVDQKAKQTATESFVPEIWRHVPRQVEVTGDGSDFGIAIFGFNRPRLIESTLYSLAHQHALHRVHVFIDGDQGNPQKRAQTNAVEAMARKFPVKRIHRRRGNLGFRKMMIQAMRFMSDNYRSILFLEDDCFPSRDCVAVFRKELETIASVDDAFSVYGHHFRLANEGEYFGRFQPWGWATTADKLRPLMAELMQCYWMDETDYLEFTNAAMTPDIRRRLDITPNRQPSKTLKAFFAWDETLALLTALRGLKHRKTATQVVYNCGMGAFSTHFADNLAYRYPPFNMVGPEEAWKYF
ncbi:MAG: sulfotransferase domain-containing protein [Hyphomicrobium sp.]|nr:sulfotransferase domain-containing protein [Hyphomicrobium sp.]